MGRWHFLKIPLPVLSFLKMLTIKNNGKCLSVNSVTYVIRGEKKSIAHRHSYILTVFVWFCPQCWLIQSRLRLRFHPQLSVKIIATKTVVNIGDYFFCSPHIWPMNKSISWTCVMVVEGMMVWFLFSFVLFFLTQYIWVIRLQLSLLYTWIVKSVLFGWCWHIK